MAGSKGQGFGKKSEAAHGEPKHELVSRSKADPVNTGHKLRARLFLPPAEADGPIGADGVQESSAVELLRQGKLGEAEAVYRKLIKEGSSNPDVYSHLAALYALSEKKEEVVDLLNQALHLNPNSADIHCQLGLALKDQGDLYAAIAVFRIALAIRPIFPAALSSLANVLQQQGDLSAAIAAYQEVLSHTPDNPEFLYNLGNAQKELGDHAAAISSYTNALHLKPDDPDTLNNLGIALNAQDNQAAAVAVYRKGLAIRPHSAVTLTNLGIALQAIGDLPGAIDAYKRALEEDPDSADTLTNLGIALKGRGELQAALRAYTRALSVKPEHPEALYNYGIALHSQGDLPGAIAAYSKALELKPTDPAAHWNLSLPLLLTGRYAEGWNHYEWRWESGQVQNRFAPFRQPAWQPTRPARRLMLWPEQGVGDEIMFGSILADARRLAPHLLVLSDPRLLPLLRRSLPGIDFHPSDQPFSDHYYDAHLPIGSLGRYLRRSLQDFPQERSGFLTADRQRSATLRSRLVADGELLCGIAWNSHNSKLGPEKSITLDRLAAALGRGKLPFRLVSLQYGDVHGEIANLQERTGIEVLQEPSVDNFLDLDGLAALIEACDLVITTSNTTVHLAGALGKPTWLLVPRPADWRWGLEGDTTPWYPSVRLFRQPERGN